MKSHISHTQIFIGCSGYYYPEWQGLFYPPQLPKGEYLRYYAQHFSCLEINNTFYRRADDMQLRRMYKQTEGKLLFSVKAHRSLTHERAHNWQDEAKAFRNGVQVLLIENVLLSVLLQFPQSFHYEPENRLYLDRLLATLKDLPLVVEFRHRDWMKESVYEGLEKRGCGICVCDMPQRKYLPAFIPLVTGNRGYIRFHGRNEQSWYRMSQENNNERYNYCYTNEELASFLPAITRCATRAQQTQIYFNNHPNASAVSNALTLRSFLEKNTHCLS